MFGIPGKSPVNLTPAAVRQIATLMQRDGAFGAFRRSDIDRHPDRTLRALAGRICLHPAGTGGHASRSRRAHRPAG